MAKGARKKTPGVTVAYMRKELRKLVGEGNEDSIFSGVAGVRIIFRQLMQKYGEKAQSAAPEGDDPLTDADIPLADKDPAEFGTASAESWWITMLVKNRPRLARPPPRPRQRNLKVIWFDVQFLRPS